jgi:2-keto-4-pentenoate hydratase/2-oxohepta-3-ene-1,7-dioic acid hydratase in catechol pathway
MRLATIVEGTRTRVAAVRDAGVLPLPAQFRSVRTVASGGEATLGQIAAWVERQPRDAYLSLEALELGPSVPDPGAIYTIGLNYRDPDRPDDAEPDRPLVYGKAPTSIVGHGSVVGWDRSLTANVDGECELGVVIGAHGTVFGYMIINDVTSQDPWLDGDQWLLGKSMPAFCPVGPWIVTADEFDPTDVRLGFTVNGVTVQDGRTSQMRFSIGEVMDYLARHIGFRPGDLVATGTPARIGPDAGRHLQPGDVMTCWIDGIGELSNTIA